MGVAEQAPNAAHSRRIDITETFIMGKYFIAWLLGVPGIVLVILYFFFH